MTGRRLLPALLAGLAVAAAVFAALPAGDDDPPAAALRAAAPEGRVLFARMACGSCHTFSAAGATAQIGPDLDGIAARHTRESLRAVIADPPRETIMPQDFGRRMTPRELDALAAWLVAERR